MNTPLRTTALATLALALTFGLASCGDQGDGNGNMDGRTGNNATLNDAGSGTSTTGASGANGTMGTTNADGSTTNGGNGTLAPGAERMNAMTDLGGLRSTLMAELEMVRTRLNDGTRPETSAKADKERAAELAQGLERLDRALAAVNASNDTTWTAIRTSTKQEVDDLRAWMDKQGLGKKQG